MIGKQHAVGSARAGHPLPSLRVFIKFDTQRPIVGATRLVVLYQCVKDAVDKLRTRKCQRVMRSVFGADHEGGHRLATGNKTTHWRHLPSSRRCTRKSLCTFSSFPSRVEVVISCASLRLRRRIDMPPTIRDAVPGHTSSTSRVVCERTSSTLSCRPVHAHGTGLRIMREELRELPLVEPFLLISLVLLDCFWLIAEPIRVMEPCAGPLLGSLWTPTFDPCLIRPRVTDPCLPQILSTICQETT